MPSDLYTAIVASLDGKLCLPEDDIETARDKMNALHYHPLKPDTEEEWRTFGGTRCAVITDNSVTDRNQYLLYAHGGAFIAGGGTGFSFYAEVLSQQLNARVVMVDYRLAPEHLFPAPLEDCCNAYIGLLDSGIPAAAIAFIGDSCGGGLAIASLLKLRDRQIAQPACAISLSGWLDLATSKDSQDLLYHQRYCHQRGIEYAAGTALTNPLISPVFADFHNLPPLLLQAGGIDPTSHQATLVYQKTIQSAGIAELDIVPEMLHGFQGFANLGVIESVAALKRAKIFCKRYFQVTTK